MLSHYSPYKVAEQFRMLETLYPGRIDLGIGRAPGGDQLATAALAYPNNPTHGELYSRQAHDLKCYLEGGFEENHPFKNLKVLPTSHSNKDDTKPELWMLGSSGGSAALAGHLGMGLSLGLFIGPMGQTTDITDEYKQAFKNAGHKGKPKVMIAVGGVCADTTEEAFHLASSQVYKKTLATSRGDNDPWISPEDVQKRLSNLSPVEERYYRKLMNSFIIGSPAECKEQMHKLSQYWQTDDIAILTVTHDYESRKKSYQLFAEQLLG
jgi:luciferase family oxidoreductase group 1